MREKNKETRIKNDLEFMRRAVAVTRRGIESGQTPFGSVIVANGQIIAETHNTVWRDLDPTAHAEINSIRRAAATVHSIDLSGSTLYSTCEPCPMCLSAIHWAKIGEVVYGASIEDAAAAGFSELKVGANHLAQLGGSPLQVRQGPLREECRELFELWKRLKLSRTY